MAVDFPFDQHQVVRFDREAGAGEGLHETGHIAAGVDPFGAGRLELLEQPLEHVRDGRILEFREQSPVKVCRDEFDSLIHAGDLARLRCYRIAE